MVTKARRVLIVGALLAALTALTGGPAAAALSPSSGSGMDKFRPAPANGIPDSYIVMLKDTATSTAPETSRRLADKYHATVTYAYSVFHGFSAYLSPANALGLSKDPAVDYVQQDAVATAADIQPNPPSWGLDRVDQPFLPLDGRYMYAGYDTGVGVNAYIVDTGIRYTHIDFGKRATLDVDFVGDGQNGNDCNGHGTEVAGVVGGKTYGVAKGVRLHAVRVLDCAGNGTDARTTAGIDWVIAHAVRPAVINLSLTGGDLDAIVNKAIAAGITVVASAGNIDSKSTTPNACNISPARVPAAITVANATSADAQSITSKSGSCVDLYAPGTNIVSAGKHDDFAIDAGLTGTSIAAPHVTGAAALFLQRNPSATPAQVASTIINAATPNVITNPGTGTPNRMLSTACVTYTLCITARSQPPGVYYGPIVVDGHGAWPGDEIQIYVRIDGGSTYHYIGDVYADSAGRFHVTLSAPYCAYSMFDVSASSIWQDSNTVPVPSIC